MKQEQRLALSDVTDETEIMLSAWTGPFCLVHRWAYAKMAQALPSGL